MKLPYNYIAIEGCIAAGKTTLAGKLAERNEAELVLEAFEKNPYLEKFYEDPVRHAFPLELFFTAERYQHMKAIQKQLQLFSKPIIADYIFYKSLIFANLTLANEDDKRLFDMLFRIMYPQVVLPEFILFLHQPVERLLAQIKKRGRSYEQNITADYLNRVQRAYISYFRTETNSRIVVLDASDLDFVNRTEDLLYIESLCSRTYEKGLHFID